MADKDLRKLSRFELLELLLASEKKNADLVSKLEEQQERVSELTEQLNKREMDLQEAGNIADASLRISGIFQCAQAAAENYLENIRTLSEKQETICAEREEKSIAEAERITSEAKAISTDMLNRVETECSEKQNETEKYCRILKETTERDCMEQREQTAADCQRLRSMTESYCDDLKSKTEEKCSTMEAEVTQRCNTMESEIAGKCEQTKAKAKAEMESYWSELSGRMEDFYRAHEGMREMLSFFNMKTPDFSRG